MPQFVYSLNGENWSGSFTTREAALAAAIQKCSGASDPPGSLFVGEISSTGALADHLGRTLVQEMRARASARGIEGAAAHLRSVSRFELEELDAQLEKVVVPWLQKHRLMPESVKVEGISEHAVPLPHMALQR